MKSPFDRHPVLRVVSKLLIPFVLMFALYVQFHGDYGPGGGFQAGVIFAAGLIAFAMVFGLAESHKRFPLRIFELLLSAGILLYGITGVICMFRGGHFLEYGMLANDPVHGQHLGILLVELGVGITVAAAMITIFLTFAGKDR